MRFRYHPTPTLRVPRGNVTCGHLYSDGVMCHEPAGPDHSHPNAFDQELSDPAPGLLEKTYEPTPPYAVLRAIYGDPADLPPILPRHQSTIDKAVESSRMIAASGVTGAQVLERITDAHAALRDAVGAVATRVDYRDQLKDDDQPWSPRTRLTASLGRRALATRVVDALPAPLAAELADRLDVLIGQAVAEAEERIKAALESAVTEKIDQISADREARARQAEEARRERFTRPSRLD